MAAITRGSVITASTRSCAPQRQLASEKLVLREEAEGPLVIVAEAATRRRAERLRAVVLEELNTSDRARLKVFGPTVEIARLVLDRIEDIPSTVELERAAAARKAAQAAAVNRRLQIERRCWRISNPERTVAATLAAIPEGRAGRPRRSRKAPARPQ